MNRSPRNSEKARKTTVYQCPICNASNSCRTSRSRLWEQPLRLFGLHPFRCLACSQRFHRNWKIPAKSIVPPPPEPLIASSESASEPVEATYSYPSLEVDSVESSSEPLDDEYNVSSEAFSDAEEPSRSRSWSSFAVPYTLKSFAILLLLHFLVGGLEFRPLGRAAMWINLLSIVTFVGALLVFIDLFRMKRASSEAVGNTVALVLRWAGLFLAVEFLFGFFLGPVGFGLNSVVALIRAQSPWIWMTYAVLPISGIIGCSFYLLYENRREV